MDWNRLNVPKFKHVAHKHYLYMYLTRTYPELNHNGATVCCDNCAKTLPFHSVSYWCPFCDFDLCIECFGNEAQFDAKNAEEFDPIVPVSFEYRNIIGSNADYSAIRVRVNGFQSTAGTQNMDDSEFPFLKEESNN